MTFLRYASLTQTQEPTMTAETITRSQIKSLRREAEEAGDMAQVELPGAAS